MTKFDRGPALTLQGGRRFYPLDPKPEEVLLEDIIRALSHTCRYGGHTNQFYSVAQHSVLLTRVARFNGFNEHIQRQCLLHDAAEAYLSDLPYPYRDTAAGVLFEKLEKRLLKIIGERFGVELVDLDQVVKTLDRQIVNDEMRALYPGLDGEPGAGSKVGVQLDVVPWGDVDFTRTMFKREAKRLNISEVSF